MPTPFTFGSVKSALAKTFDGGYGQDDARVLEYANDAIAMLMRDVAEVTPRGVFVGGVDQITVTLGASNAFNLPNAYETVLEIEVANSQDINVGWYNLMDMSGLMDADNASDAVFLNNGEVTVSGETLRQYLVPDATGSATVKVMAKKKYLPMTGDSSVCIIRNLDALKYALKSLQYAHLMNDADGSKAYKDKALAAMKAELDGYLADPTHAMLRKRNYIVEENTYAKNSLGYVRARLALDLPGGLTVGRVKFTRLVNRACERLVQRTNELRTTGRLRVKTGLSNLTFVTAVVGADVLQITDYEQIRSMVMSFLPGATPDMESRAYSLLESEETLALETLRQTTYASGLQTYISSGYFTRLGYYVNKLQLELPDSLTISDVEMRRLVNEAARQAVARRNELGATEDYSNAAGPDSITFAYALTDADPISYPDYEVIAWLVMSQLPAPNPDLKNQAFSRIEANLKKTAVSVRNEQWHCLLSLPRYSYGHQRAEIGLGLAERGWILPDAKVGRMVNNAEEVLSRTPNFVYGEAVFDAVTDSKGIITLPGDSERIIYADICGWPLDIKGRSFEYIGFPGGLGVQPNLLSNWLWINPFGYRGRAGLQDRGINDDGLRTYYLDGSCVLPDDADLTDFVGTSVRVVVKRKWMPKATDNDVMLIQNLQALRMAVESEMARLDKDVQGSAALMAGAKEEMDRQLANNKGAEMDVPRIRYPGITRTGGLQKKLWNRGTRW